MHLINDSFCKEKAKIAVVTMQYYHKGFHFVQGTQIHRIYKPRLGFAAICFSWPKLFQLKFKIRKVNIFHSCYIAKSYFHFTVLTVKLIYHSHSKKQAYNKHSAKGRKKRSWLRLLTRKPC